MEILGDKLFKPNRQSITVNVDFIQSVSTYGSRWMCTEWWLRLLNSIYNLQLYAPGRNAGGYIDRQSCFLSGVVGGRLVARVW